MTSPTFRDWEIIAPRDVWQAIRSDERFIELVRVARVVNSLAQAYGPLIHTLEDQSPAARRNRFAAFFYAAALLKEGLDTAQSLGKHFRHLKQYKEGFGAILADADVQGLRSELLSKVRNELVFHFDRDAIAQGLSQFADSDSRILSASEFSHGEIYYDIADDAVLGYLFGDAPTEKEYVRRLAHFMEELTELANRFMAASHSLLAVALRELGCKKRQSDRPLPPADDAV